MTFGTVAVSPRRVKLGSMRSTTINREQHFLILSGFLAIGVTAYILLRYFEFWPSAPLVGAFAVAFAVGAYGRFLGIPERFDVLSIAAMLLLSLAILWIVRDTVVLILSVVFMASAPHHLTARQSWLLLLVANGAYLSLLSGEHAPADYLASWFSLLALQGFALTSSLSRQRELLTQQLLSRQNNELLAARAVLAKQSQADERLRIAGDLHDTIGHRLTALRLQLEALAHQAPEALRPQVEGCQSLSADLLEDIRSIVRRMAEESSDDLKSAIAQLESLTPGVKITVDSPLPTLDADLAQQLVFCCSEAVHNAIRHGGATQLQIRYSQGCFSITDNGGGLRGKPVKPGFGLQNINKRIAPFGGKATLGPATVTSTAEEHSARGCELRIELAGTS